MLQQICLLWSTLLGDLGTDTGGSINIQQQHKLTDRQGLRQAGFAAGQLQALVQHQQLLWAAPLHLLQQAVVPVQGQQVLQELGAHAIHHVTAVPERLS